MDWPVHDGMKELYDLMVNRCDAAQAGRMSTRQAADDLWGVLSTANFMTQPFGFGDRERRFMHPTPKVVAKSALWAGARPTPWSGRCCSPSAKRPSAADCAVPTSSRPGPRRRWHGAGGRKVGQPRA
jgi:FADH2 O2-dependent halogenase